MPGGVVVGGVDVGGVVGGVVGVVVPEADGGLGMTEVDLVLVLEETGRCALPEPIVETAAVAAPMLAARGDARARDLVNGASAAVGHALSPHAVWADTATVIVAMGSSQTVVAPRETFVLSALESVDGARAGASSRTTWALVPPMPNELTPARRGPAAFQSVNVVLTKNGLPEKSIFGLGAS